MNTPLLPDAAENAANALDRILAKSLQMDQRILALIAKVSVGKNADGTPLTQAQIIAARPRLAGLPAFITHKQNGVVMLAGTPAAAKPTPPA